MFVPQRIDQRIREIGIVVALPAEAVSLLGSGSWRAGRCVARSGAYVTVAGIGAQRAAEAAGRLVDQGVRALMSWGIAGALSPALHEGDLLVPAQICSVERNWSVDAAWRAAIVHALSLPDRQDGAQLWCSKTPVRSVEDKRHLAARGLYAVDMESAAVAEAAEWAGLPFVAVKAVCDPATRALPAAATALLHPDGSLRLRGLAGVACGGPRLWRELYRLRHDQDAACRGLCRAAQCLPQAWAS